MKEIESLFSCMDFSSISNSTKISLSKITMHYPVIAIYFQTHFGDYASIGIKSHFLKNFNLILIQSPTNHSITKTKGKPLPSTTSLTVFGGQIYISISIIKFYPP